ncbi:MAG: amino acid permease [Candidatus Aenigmarchaeota archaeon]|nr:amino acid permease [Candidatus Aenigmarchaeota archaeon]
MSDIEGHFKEAELKRGLSLFSATMIGVGAIIGSIVFVLIGTASGIAGPAILLAFFLNGIGALITAMSYAELGSAFPEAGGGYLWVKKAMKGPQAFLSGWMNWFSHAIVGSFYALTFGTYLTFLMKYLNIQLPFPEPITIKIATTIVCLVFFFINYKGVSYTGKIENVTTILQLIIFVVFIVGGLSLISHNPNWKEGFTPFFPNGWAPVGVVMGLTFIAFEGFEIIVQTGEEIKNPKKNIPRAIFLSLAIVVPIYLLLIISLLGGIVIPGQPTWQWLGGLGERGMVEAAKILMPYGDLFLLVIGVVSCMAALDSTIFSSTRVLFAMARDHNVPNFFRKVHEANRVPHLSLVGSAVIILFMAVFFDIELVAASADIMFILLFIQINYAVVKIRHEMGNDIDYGFKTPFFPYLPYLGLLIKVALGAFLIYHYPIATAITVFWLALGAFLYYGYGREKEVVEKERIEMLSSPEEYRILTAISETAYVKPLMTLSTAIAKSQNSEIVALNVVEMPYQSFLRSGKRFLEERIPLLETAVREGEAAGVKVTKKEIIAHNTAKAIIDFSLSTKTNLIMMGWSGQITSRKVARSVPEKILKDAKCVTAILKEKNFREPKNILVTGSKRDYITRIKIADWIATSTGGTITVLSILPDSERKNVREIRKDHLKYMEFCKSPIESKIVIGDTERVLITSSKKYDLLIIGPSTEWILKKFLFGSTQDTVANDSHCSVLFVKDPEIKVDSFANLLAKKIVGK